VTTHPPRDVHPFLHDLVTCLCAPATLLSGVDGQVRADGAQGLLAADVRHLSELVVAVDGVPPTAIGHQQVSADSALFVGAVRELGDPIADPTVRLERRRLLAASGLQEAIALVNDGRTAVRAVLTVRLACDLALLEAVKRGRRTAAVPPRAEPGVLAAWDRGPWRTTVSTEAGPGPDAVVVAGDHVLLTWQLDVPSRDRADVVLTVACAVHHAAAGEVVFHAPLRREPWPHRVAVASHEPALDRLAATGLGDLRALVLADGPAAGDRPDDLFVAAGSPWFMTLFGRDSLWTARFTLPLGTGLAQGTLRTLARRQGTRHDQATAEQPGKIPHEIRRVLAGVATGLSGLPPTYYGTIDATPLWISLLHDAWRWGLPPAEVAELLDPLERALDWVMVHGDEDGDGFLEYHDELGRGLANQGWKDSGDAIQDARGRLTTPPVTLSEAQAYAHRAALDAAALLDAFGRPGAAEARTHAAGLEKRFRGAFWVGSGADAFPALALDGDKRPVDALTSNIGHLLDSGLLTVDETARVAALLGDARLQSGYGLRTLDASHPRFNPLGYHTGSVWPHDTAIVVDRLARSGHAAPAAALAEGLVRAGTRFGHRLPELYDVDVPAGRLRVAPPAAFAAWFPLRVSGLDVAGHPLTIEVDPDGRPTVTTDAPLAVETS
jgi:hypothetical protein